MSWGRTVHGRSSICGQNERIESLGVPLGFSSVDAGHGWLIFALPPAEVAVHPAEDNGRHELYFMCDDLKAEMSALGKKGVPCSEVKKERWGSITRIRLPGGSEIGLYQPKHATALAPKAKSSATGD